MPQKRKHMDIAHVQLHFYSYRRVDTRVVTVDQSIWSQVSKYHWYLIGGDDGKKIYACCGDISSPCYLHRMAFELTYQQKIPTDMVIDHISGWSLDNTAANLRCVTRSNNSLNRNKPVLKRGESSSKYKGVWARSHRRKDGTLIKSYVAEFNVKGHKKETNTFSVKKHGTNAEKMGAKWYNEMMQTKLPNGCYRLNPISSDESSDGEEDADEVSSDMSGGVSEANSE